MRRFAQQHDARRQPRSLARRSRDPSHRGQWPLPSQVRQNAAPLGRCAADREESPAPAAGVNTLPHRRWVRIRGTTGPPHRSDPGSRHRSSHPRYAAVMSLSACGVECASRGRQGYPWPQQCHDDAGCLYADLLQRSPRRDEPNRWDTRPKTNPAHRQNRTTPISD
jgi:hypothetical protein